MQQPESSLVLIKVLEDLGQTFKNCVVTWVFERLPAKRLRDTNVMIINERHERPPCLAYCVEHQLSSHPSLFNTEGVLDVV